MKYFLKPLIIILMLIASVTNMPAQAPPHPNGGATPGGSVTNTPVGGGAPIGSGTMLLIGLAGLYGGKKAYRMQKNR